jgi:hypothetical protein
MYEEQPYYLGKGWGEEEVANKRGSLRSIPLEDRLTWVIFDAARKEICRAGSFTPS